MSTDTSTASVIHALIEMLVVLAACAIIINPITMAIFARPRLRTRSHSAYLLLFCMADWLYEICFLLIVMGIKLGTSLVATPGLCQLVQFSLAFASTSSPWAIVAFTVERSVVVMTPFRSHMFKGNLPWHVVIVLCVCSSLLNCPFLFMTGVVPFNVTSRFTNATTVVHECLELSGSLLAENPGAIDHLDLIINFCIPCTIIVLGNTLIIYRCFVASKWRNKNSTTTTPILKAQTIPACYYAQRSRLELPTDAASGSSRSGRDVSCRIDHQSNGNSVHVVSIHSPAKAKQRSISFDPTVQRISIDQNEKSSINQVHIDSPHSSMECKTRVNYSPRRRQLYFSIERAKDNDRNNEDIEEEKPSYDCWKPCRCLHMTSASTDDETPTTGVKVNKRRKPKIASQHTELILTLTLLCATYFGLNFPYFILARLPVVQRNRIAKTLTTVAYNFQFSIHFFIYALTHRMFRQELCYIKNRFVGWFHCRSSIKTCWRPLC